VHLVSTVTGEGIDAVAAHARPGRTLAVIGASGVGKSSLVNALAGAPVLDVGAVRQVDGKGRHVTVRRELVPLPTGAVVLDTPGLRGVALWASGDVEAVDGLSAAFSDIEALAADCRFRDCGHRGEPGCAVAAAADAGLLDADRIARHDKLRRELAYLERKQDVRAALEEKRRWKQIHRDNRARGGRP
jgi:ribosome biogenesis GTPase